eukprot:jgi/Psemu1/290869/fgenesh1_pg.575_\
MRKPKPKEWPPSFQNDGSAFTFDTRSAMFYEPLSDFFYDPKSKLYYGNKKSAYFRYDDTSDPPLFVEVKRMTTEEVEEQRGAGGGGLLSQEKLTTTTSDSAVPVPPKPKIAIKLKTKKVRSSLSTVAAIEGRNSNNNNNNNNQQSAAATAAATTTTTTAMVGRAKKEQIANIGKWTEKQAELKQSESDVVVAAASAARASAASATGTGGSAAASEEGSQTQTQTQIQPQTPRTTKVRTTAKGEPICTLCKRKFPTMEKLRLHEKASELHKKNLLRLQEKKKQQQLQLQKDPGAKRKLDDNRTDAANVHSNTNTSTTQAANETVYTDRAQKRRQLHGVDLSTPANGLSSLRRRQDERYSHARPMPSPVEAHADPTPTPGSDLLDETNVGHQLLQKKTGLQIQSVR